jgi:hypothetical protein
MGANYFRLITINMFKPSIKMGLNNIIFIKSISLEYTSFFLRRIIYRTFLKTALLICSYLYSCGKKLKGSLTASRKRQKIRLTTTQDRCGSPLRTAQSTPNWTYHLPNAVARPQGTRRKVVPYRAPATYQVAVELTEVTAVKTRSLLPQRVQKHRKLHL